MILGLTISVFTTLHVIISLIGIFTGLVVLAKMLSGRSSSLWTVAFLATTVATSVTGFMFPLTRIGPPHIVGVISMVVLAVALYALYGKKQAGHWRGVYIASAVTALYLNVFVGVVQAFQKLEPFQVLAPTQSEPPFVVAQTFVLVLFAALGYVAVKRSPLNTVIPAKAGI